MLGWGWSVGLQVSKENVLWRAFEVTCRASLSSTLKLYFKKTNPKTKPYKRCNITKQLGLGWGGGGGVGVGRGGGLEKTLPHSTAPPKLLPKGRYMAPWYRLFKGYPLHTPYIPLCNLGAHTSESI